MPALPAMQEAEIRRIVIPGHPGQKSSGDSISTEKKVSILLHACHPIYGGKPKIGGS
jgi:hypothetical protein